MNFFNQNNNNSNNNSSNYTSDNSSNYTSDNTSNNNSSNYSNNSHINYNTKTDIEKINEYLKDYIHIHEDNYEDIDVGTWVKYITNEHKYRSGGVLVCNKAPEYFMLRNPYNKFKWSINLKNNEIFIKENKNQDRKKVLIEKNNLYKLYLAGYVKILDTPEMLDSQ